MITIRSTLVFRVRWIVLAFICFPFPETDEGKKVNICTEFIYFNFIWSERSRSIVFYTPKQIRISVFVLALVKTRQDDFSINDVEANTKSTENFNIFHFLSHYKTTSFSLGLLHCFHYKIFIFKQKLMLISITMGQEIP